jgi:hypothetical protein
MNMLSSRISVDRLTPIRHLLQAEIDEIADSDLAIITAMQCMADALANHGHGGLDSFKKMVFCAIRVQNEVGERGCVMKSPHSATAVQCKRRVLTCTRWFTYTSSLSMTDSSRESSSTAWLKRAHSSSQAESSITRRKTFLGKRSQVIAP